MWAGVDRERIVAVVPIRSFHNGKTRLASVLDRAERESLLRHAAVGVVAAARWSGSIETVLVVSPDPEVLAWANQLGPEAAALEQSTSQQGLNGAIDAGRTWAMAEGAAAVLSLFADLPILCPDDIRSLTAQPEPVVLGPDRQGEGTNALLVRLDGNGAAFRFAFGEGSLGRHVDEARRLGLESAIVHAAGVAFDLDTPDDWSDLLAVRPTWGANAEPLLASCEASIT
jgi:2-phospho-L-lactate guanylyltransferase